MVADGITTGSPIFLGLALAGSEGHDAWADFLADLVGRGLCAPVLVVSDGARAAERGRTGLPAVTTPTVHNPPRPATCWRRSPSPPRLRSRPPTGDLRRHHRPGRPGRGRRGHPARRGLHRPVRALLPGRGPLPGQPVGRAHRAAAVPAEHWQRIRHTNLLCGCSREAPADQGCWAGSPGERSCLGLVRAVLDRASRGWPGLAYTPAATRQLQDLRRDLFTPPTTKVIIEPVTAAT